MNIAYVFESFLPNINGVITATLDLAKRMVERGHKVIFIVPASAQTPDVVYGIPVVGIPSVELSVYPGLRFILPWSRIPEAVIKREKIDIVHITGPSTVALASMRAAKRQGVQVVHTWHTNLLSPEYMSHIAKGAFFVSILTSIGRRMFKRFLTNVVITTPERLVGVQLKRLYPHIDPLVIANGIDLSLGTNEKDVQLRDELFGPIHKHTFLYVGRISSEKSIGVVVEALKHLSKRNVDFQFIAIGDGPDYDAMQRLVSHYHLTACARFVGRIPHETIMKSGIYESCFAFVSASTSEVQGVTYIESLTTETPLIIVDDILTHAMVDDAALYCKPGDSKDFAKAMLRLIEEKAVYESLKKACGRVRMKFDGEQSADKFDVLYEQILQGTQVSS